MDLLRHGEIRDYGIYFLDEDGNVFDPQNPRFEVSHYVNNNGTTTWVQDVPDTPLIRIDTGHYTCTIEIDENVFILDEVYYVRFRGYDSVNDVKQLDERVFKVVDFSTTPGGGDSSICNNNLVARFVF